MNVPFRPVIVCVLFFQVAGLGVDYHVDAANGDDGNSGLSPTTAWRTIGKVNSSSFAPGDRILLRRGQTWREQLIVPSSGVADQPITIGAYGEGDRPVLKGSALVSSWTAQGSDNIWQTPLSTAPSQVFFDGVRGTRESAVSNLNVALEWYWSSGALYVYATSNPGGSTIEASIRPAARTYGLLHVQNRSYVTLESIEVTQSNSFGLYLKPSGQYLTVRDCEVSHSRDGGLVAANAGGAAVSKVTVENCIVHHNNGGFKEGAPGVETYHEGLTMELVDGFTIRGCQVYANYMEGVNFKRGARNGVIENCRLYANGLINQYMEGATNIEFRYNRVYDCTYNAGVEFGLETNTHHNDNVKIHHNLFWNNTGGVSFWAAGGATAQTRNIQIHNNTFYDNGYAIRWKSGATDNYSGTNSLKNNVIWQRQTYNYGIGDETSGDQGIARTAIAYNVFQSGARNDATGSSALVLTDPYFVNAGALDFHLRSGSRCIDSGTSLGMLRDFDGNKVPQGAGPDRGAYEYGSTTTTTYSLSTSASNGTITRTPNQTSYAPGTTVTLQATANSGYTFSGWSGDLTGTTNPATLVMNANKTVAASFAANTYTLTISAANGSVTKNPDRASYVHGEMVTLQAQPDPGYTFTGWSGDASGANSSTTVTMNADKSVVASFTAKTVTLSVSAVNGSVTKTPNKTNFTYGETVTLEAVPDSGYTFTGWSGDASGTGSPIVLTMNADKSVTAGFTSEGLDRLPPGLTDCSPSAGSIQAPPNTLVSLHVCDDGTGVDPASVAIRVNGNLVYSGDVDSQRTTYGVCHRSGTKADYTFTYQQRENYAYGGEVSVAVGARDLAGNVMPEQTYSFATQMYCFGANRSVSADQMDLDQGKPATAADGQGNIWVVWHAGDTGQRHVYAARFQPEVDTYGSTVQVSQSTGDHCDPALAIDGAGTLYVAWQENPRGLWDVCLSTSVDGKTWSAPKRVVDATDNQDDQAANRVNAAIAAGSNLSNLVAVAWQDDRAGHQDVYVARSTKAFAAATISRVTSDVTDQTDPAIAIDGQDTVYVLWTDARNGSNDIYGAASDVGPWTNKPVAVGTASQSQPVVAVGSAGSVLHIAWVDNVGGGPGIFYAATEGLSANPLMGRSIIDDATGAVRQAPVIVVAAQANGPDRAFVCWEDGRNVAYSGDTDLYFAEVGPGSPPTNVLVNDGGRNSNQHDAALGTDRHGYPYVVWTDDTDQGLQVYYSGVTYADPVPLVEKEISASAGGGVGTAPEDISTLDDVSVVVPAQACSFDPTISIARVRNPQGFATESLRAYEFGPSGLSFVQLATITIPYPARSAGKVRACWFDSATGTFSDTGVTDVQDISAGSDLHALRFKTSHFTPFYLVAADSTGTGAGGGGGGGCSLAVPGDGDALGYFVPYLMTAAIALVWRRRDVRRHTARGHKLHAV